MQEQTDMPIECKLNRAGYVELLAFITEIECNITQFKLLCFMVRHPLTKLSIDSIASVLDISRACLMQEVTGLTGKGVIQEQNDNGSITYSLSGETEIHKNMAILAALDWNEKLNIMARLRNSSCS
jgi:predicted transcriptional regulator